MYSRRREEREGEREREGKSVRDDEAGVRELKKAIEMLDVSDIESLRNRFINVL